jgi:hypothetical protein
MLHKVGDKVRFRGDRRAYTVQACNDRFAVCTKLFAARGTVIYTIIDIDEGVRGTENLVFCAGFETQHECKEAIERLASGETEVSRRNRVPLAYD